MVKVFVGVGVLLGVSLLGGCRSTAVAVQNLDAVLGSNDQFRYQGATTGVWEDLFKGGVGRILAPFTGKSSGQEELRAIPNPTELALENLLRLTDSDQGNKSWRHNEKVRVLARYAALSPSQLTRERALLSLAAHGERLGVDGPPEPREGGALAANAPELIEGLSGLVDAAGALIAGGEGAGASARADFDAAVDVLGGARYDVAGGSRLLRALGSFLRSSRLPARQRTRLEELSEEVQRELVSQALAAGLADPSAVARAAAFRSHYALHGDSFVVEALQALVGGSAEEGGGFDRFDVPTVPVSDDEVFVEVLGWLERGGLPEAAREETLEGLSLRASTLRVLIFIASSRLALSDRVRFAAMDALETVSGGELSTLREEEWAMWFEQKAEELGEAYRALEAAEGQGRS